MIVTWACSELRFGFGSKTTGISDSPAGCVRPWRDRWRTFVHCPSRSCTCTETQWGTWRPLADQWWSPLACSSGWPADSGSTWPAWAKETVSWASSCSGTGSASASAEEVEVVCSSPGSSKSVCHSSDRCGCCRICRFQPSGSCI